MPPVYRTAVLAETTVPTTLHAQIRATFPPEWHGFLGDGPPATYRPPGYRVCAGPAADVTVFAGQLALVPLAAGVWGIADWFTVPTARRTGVARALAAATVAWADAHAVTLLVDTGDPGLRRVCARHGFTPVTRRTEVQLCVPTPDGTDGTTTAVLLANLMARGPVHGLTLTEKF